MALAQRIDPEDSGSDRAADHQADRARAEQTARATKAKRRWKLGARVAMVGLLVTLWWAPPPEGITIQAWRLFAIFATAILAVVVDALPILTASVLAVAAAVLTGLLKPDEAYAGFANSTILLIVVAFLVANAVVTCGLGRRGGHWIVSKFGRSTLGLGYSLF